MFNNTMPCERAIVRQQQQQQQHTARGLTNPESRARRVMSCHVLSMSAVSLTSGRAVCLLGHLVVATATRFHPCTTAACGCCRLSSRVPLTCQHPVLPKPSSFLLALPCPWVAYSTSCTVTFACTCCAQPAVCVRLARRCARISRSKGRASEQARSPPLSSCAQSVAHGMSSPRSLILRLVRAQKPAQAQLGSLDGMG